MHLLLVGISHKTAPVELRERLDFQVRGVDRALQALAARGSTREAVVLSTCNRAELYVACDDLTATLADLVSFVSEFNAIDPPAVAPHVYDVADLDAARHLFRVAAGLDSLVVGEPQVFGQVKEAHTIAGGVHTVGPVLNRLFHASFVVGKRVRTETRLGSGSVSISYAAVALARKIFGDLGGRTVVVVGAGEMGKLTARHMKTQGVHHVTIVSRTMAHAARTADAIGGATAAPWEDLDEVLGTSDIVITATGASAPILTKARIEAIMRPRRNRPLFIIDIPLPRDARGLHYKPAALPREAREHARTIVDEIPHLIVEKLLLTPTEQLKSLGDTETVGAYTEALTRLFGLTDREHADADDGGPAGRAARPR